MTITATYDPADDKIRISASSRLDPEDYQKVKAAGYGWAPKQGVFYAVWSPVREDVALALSGQDELEDEDTTLVERAEARAERFDGYSERRAADAAGARKGVAAIADNIPFGQPILVGHHSERRARKDAERIRSGMAKAVKMWKTSTYWTDRAASALAHAEHKELPAVRARRIKTLEAELRGYQRTVAKAEALIKLWSREGLTKDQALAIANGMSGSYYRCYPLADFPRQPPASQYEGEMSIWSALNDGIIDEKRAAAFVLPGAMRVLEPTSNTSRCIEHVTNRIAYERAMLGESGGLVGESFKYEVGGRVLRRGEWFPIAKVNTREGKVISVTVVGHFAATVSLDEIKDYRPPAEGDGAKMAAAMDKGPMCNYPGPGFVHMTSAEWKALPRYSDCAYTENHKATEAHGRHRTKHRPLPGFKYACVFISDAKRVDPPAPVAAPVPVVVPVLDDEAIRAQLAASVKRTSARAEREAADAPFKAIEQSLKAGVQVVSAPQLFPTPAPLAARMVELADIGPGMRVLEPSAGTGAIINAIVDAEMAPERAGPAAQVVAVEVNAAVYRAMNKNFCDSVVCEDFLALAPTSLGMGGLFDRVVMNPPFTRGEDVKHVLHAHGFLKPDGRLVALCADGPGRREAFAPLIEECGGSYRPLPEGSFREQGTNVRVAMVVINGRAA